MLAKITRLLLLVGFAIITQLCSGCSGDVSPGYSEGEVLIENPLAWPPVDGISHHASDTETTILGKDTSFHGGNIGISGDSLTFAGSGLMLPWAVYAIDELSETNELIDVSVTFTATPLELGDGTAIYIALANHERGHWEWIAPVASPWAHAFSNPTDYRSSLGTAHVAVVLAGPGNGTVDLIAFTHSANFVNAPTNLTADVPAVETVDLDWDDVTGASGYNVYRSVSPTMTGAVLVNPSPIIESEHTDDSPTGGRHCFYAVTALGYNESPYSNIVRAWVIQADLPAPQNVRVGDQTEDSFTIEWDWEGTEPYDFELFIDTVPDFIIDSGADSRTAFGFKPRAYTFINRQEGITYFIKMCAREIGSLRGRLSDEIPATVGDPPEYWTWDVHTIGVGGSKVRATAVGTDEIAVAYFNSDSVDLAIGMDDTWEIEKPLTGGYDIWFDMAYGGGNYILGAYHLTTGDAWVATGVPGSWNEERLHGDGSTALGHPESGFDVAVGASDTEFAYVHEAVLHAENGHDPGMVLHTRAISGDTWTEQIIRTFGENKIVSLSTCFAWVGENLNILSTDKFVSEVYWGDRDGGWAWQDVLGGTGDYMPSGQDLHWFQDQWYTPGFSAGYKKLYLLNGTDLPWTITEMLYGSDYGFHSRLAVESEEAIMTFYGNGQYHMALYSDEWAMQPINIPGTPIGEFGEGADVVLLDGNPYLVFQDEVDGNIKIAKGTPPAE